MRKADQARDTGDAARAAILYRSVLDSWGESFGLLVQLGNALKDSGSFSEAEQAYFGALRIDPLDADCHLQIGHLMKLAANPSAAAEYYHNAHRLDPYLPDPIREIRQLEATLEQQNKASVQPEPVPAPVRMRVEAVDTGNRSRVLRDRVKNGMKWRRD